MLLFIVNWRAANAAQRNADLAARELRLRTRPLVTVTWADPVSIDGIVSLHGTLAEVTGVPTLLHVVEYLATPVASSLTSPVATRLVPHKILSRDVATFPILMQLRVPEWSLSLVAGPHVNVADLEVRVTISPADDEQLQEQWGLLAALHYEKDSGRYSVLTIGANRFSGPRGPRSSRVLDPVLDAWQRWWSSVS